MVDGFVCHKTHRPSATERCAPVRHEHGYVDGYVWFFTFSDGNSGGSIALKSKVGLLRDVAECSLRTPFDRIR